MPWPLEIDEHSDFFAPHGKFIFAQRSDVLDVRADLQILIARVCEYIVSVPMPGTIGRHHKGTIGIVFPIRFS